MARAADIVSILLLIAAAVVFAQGMISLGHQQDLNALYWLVVGAILLRASVDLLRPKSGGDR